MKTITCLIAVLTCTSASAEVIYRCGPDGRSYSQTPCEEGRRLDLRDERSAGQRQEAQAVAQTERALGETLERDRLGREADTPPARAGNIGSRPSPAATASAQAKARPSKKKHKGRHPAADDDFRAIVPTRSHP